MNYLLEAYTTGDVIAETDTKIIRSTQTPNSTPIKYDELLWAKALRCNRVYNGYILKGNLIKELQDYIRQNTRSFWNSSKHATVQNLARHVISLANLQNGLRLGKETRNSDKHGKRCDSRRTQPAATMYLAIDRT